jgi:pyruvate/2-oxoacid:ferredoxin oxidoreductase beta subunit
MTTKLTKKELTMYSFSYIIAVCRCITYSEYTHYKMYG